LGRRPGDLPFGLGAWFEADMWPAEPEVIELLRIDFRELLGLKRGAEVPHGRRCRLGGVVPAGEGHDEDGPAQALRTGVDCQHRSSLRRCKGKSSTNGQLTNFSPDCRIPRCPNSLGGSDHVREALALDRGGNRTLARWRLRVERGVADVAVEHQPLRVEGALRLLDEEPFRGSYRDAPGRCHGPEPELVREGGHGRPGPDPRALDDCQPSATSAPFDVSGGSLASGECRVSWGDSRRSNGL